MSWTALTTEVREAFDVGARPGRIMSVQGARGIAIFWVSWDFTSYCPSYFQVNRSFRKVPWRPRFIFSRTCFFCPVCCRFVRSLRSHGHLVTSHSIASCFRRWLSLQECEDGARAVV